MAGNGQKWPEMSGNGWKWKEWLKMAGNVWKWMKMRMMMLENQIEWPYHTFDCVLLSVQFIFSLTNFNQTLNCLRTAFKSAGHEQIYS